MNVKMELATSTLGLNTAWLFVYQYLQSKYELKNQEMIDYKQKAHYWEAQFNQLKSREEKLNEKLKEKLEEVKAQLRKREQQLYGKKSEKNTAQSEQTTETQKNPKKKRGQQVGSKGHGRRDYNHLPVVHEDISLTEEAATCPCCHLPYEELPGSVNSEIIEVVSVSAYCRKIHKKIHKRKCACKQNHDPMIVSPPSERLLPKSKFGMTIWALLLLKKYEYQQPIYRALEELEGFGLSLAMGTVIDGFKKLLPLFIPIYNAIVEHNISANHWHADETGWKVFESLEGKANNRWFLWIFHNKESVVYKVSPTRSSSTLTEYFGDNHSGGILNVDRYGAYKVIAKSGIFILAFCWAHVRRDFLNHTKAYPDQETWALSWVKLIGDLYHINNQRIQHNVKSKNFHLLDINLRLNISKMREEIIKQVNDDMLLPSAKKLLKSLDKHWEGLTIFVDHPEIPMDNNEAERGLRGSVIGRKNYYGSGAIWSAELAAALFTIFKTLKLWKLNAHTWLLTYFYECSLLSGAPPKKINNYLPWKMTEKQKAFFTKPPKYENYGLVSNPGTC
jgi:transposase